MGGKIMRSFDYSFLERGMVPAVLVEAIGEICELREREKAHKKAQPDVFVKLESVAKVRSVKHSNEIDGIRSSDRRLDEIVYLNFPPLTNEEAVIAGYRDALELINSHYASLEIWEPDILRFHEIMLSYSPDEGGLYKLFDNVIVGIDSGGGRNVRFEPTPAAETAETMKRLIHAYMEARDRTYVYSLLLIPCFILDFLCVHPFTVGNGRISRLLSLLLLYKSGHDVGRYFSFEEQIGRNQEWYYRALQKSSDGWHTEENSYFPFMENFIFTLRNCYRAIEDRFSVSKGEKLSKRRRIEARVLNSPVPISKREVCDFLPDVSLTTVEAVLGDMFNAGLIQKVDSGRKTKYFRK
jgi:Fic family protein